jgi:hypothetical protein
MKFKLFFIILFSLSLVFSYSQNRTVLFNINTINGRIIVDSSIYGLNEFNIDQTIKQGLGITTRRLGGNRFSTYNWENNASSSPTCANDDYLSSNAYPIPVALRNNPGELMIAFHDSSLAYSYKSLLTVQMLGFVPRDKNGLLISSDYAPSQSRLCNVLPFIPNGVPPINLKDSTVYIDEMIAFLVGKYGKTSKTKNSINYYLLDNEPNFWSGVHTCLHPTKQTCIEILNKSISYSKAIKSQDSLAFVFAGVYTWLAHNNFNYATDWSAINSGNQYKRFTEWFLKSLKDSTSLKYPKLIDVLDIHYYSKAQGKDNSGTFQNVDNGPDDKGVSIARMQAPRSLWDSTFIENGSYSVKNNNQPLILIPELQSEIKMYYPGIKLSFSEYNFGGGNHISGGIAHTDFLGICARFGVFGTNFWNTSPVSIIPNYHYSALKIFRNYDGNFSKFGKVMLKADNLSLLSMQRDTLSSAYASIDDKDSTIIHVILLNKDYQNSIDGQIQISSKNKYSNAEIWKFDSMDFKIMRLPSINSITNNKFQYTIPPLTVIHIVLSNKISTGLINPIPPVDDFNITIYPNPFKDEVSMKSNNNQNFDLELYDYQGKRILSKFNLDGSIIQIVKINENNANGIYLMRVNESQCQIKRIIKLIKVS